jgi:hypothetical protein
MPRIQFLYGRLLILQIHKSDPTECIIDFFGNPLLIAFSALEESAKIHDWYLAHDKEDVLLSSMHSV